MNRRRFLSLLGAGVAAMALDPERALWKPEAKTIFLPPVTGWSDRDRISIRCVREYSLTMPSPTPFRMDVLYGVAVLRPELACRVMDQEQNEIALVPATAPVLLKFNKDAFAWAVEAAPLPKGWKLLDAQVQRVSA